MLEVLLAFLLLVVLPSVVAVRPLGRMLHARRRAELHERINLLERELGIDDESVARETARLEREALAATKRRLRKVVRAAVGSTFDAHFAAQRGRLRASLNQPWQLASATSAVAVNYTQIVGPWLQEWRSDLAHRAAVQHKRDVDNLTFFGARASDVLAGRGLGRSGLAAQMETDIRALESAPQFVVTFPGSEELVPCR